MASKTIGGFPAAASVSAYSRASQLPSNLLTPPPPSGTPVETETAGADGRVTFSALAAGTEYVATDGSRVVSFETDDASSVSGGSSVEVAGRAWAPNTAYKAGDVVVQGGVLYSAKADFTSGATFSSVNWNAVGGPALGPVLAQPVLDTGPAGMLTIAAGGTNVYNAFPGIAEMPNGKGIIVWRKSSAHTAGSPISLQVSYSTDTTWQTWTAPAQLLSVASRDLRDAAVSVIGTRVYVTFFASTGTSTSRAHSEGYIYSDDNGATWSPYVDSMGPDTFTQYARCSGPLVKAANNDVLWPVHGQNIGDGSNWTTAVLISHDNATTWPTQVTVFASGGTQNFQEMNVVLLHDGTTLLAAAKNLTDNLIYVATSTDHGQSWTSLGGKMNGDGRAALDVDPDTGRVYCATRRPTTGRHVLYWSDDNGATWSPNPTAAGTSASGKTLDERPTIGGSGDYAQMVRRASRPGEVAIVLGTEVSGGSNSADITLRWMRTRGGSTPVGTVAPAGDTVISGGRWNGAHEVIETPDAGNYHRWVDALGHPRFKLNVPTSDTDGAPLGLERRVYKFITDPFTITAVSATANTEVTTGAGGTPANATFTRLHADLTGMTSYRISANTLQGLAGTTLKVQYSTDGGTTWVDLTTTISTATAALRRIPTSDPWNPVPAAAQGQVQLRLVTSGGDGASNVIVAQVQLETYAMA
jgi:hypothetical protein